MASSKYIFMLDLHGKKGQITLPVTQGDTDREFHIGFSDGARPYILEEGSTAMISIVRPTGTEVQEYCKIEENGAKVLYPFSDHTCVVAGLHSCQILLFNARGKQIASPKFSMDAAPKLIDHNDEEIPDEDVNAFDAIYQSEAERRAYFEELKERVAAGEFMGGQGPQGPQGPPGDDYVLTDEDKEEILATLLEPIPNGDEVKY